jgi:ATP-binding cassette subfamily F protein uup
LIIQQELTTLPEKIEKAEVEIGEIQLKLSDPEFFQRDESQDALIRLSRLEADLVFPVLFRVSCFCNK